MGEQLGVLATLGTLEPARRYSLAPHGEQLYVRLRFRPNTRLTDRLITDLGLRWDEQTYLPASADEQFSPRASLLYRLDSRSPICV